MYKATMPYGRKGATIMAVFAVDLAIWDLAAKAYAKTLVRFLAIHRRFKRWLIHWRRQIENYTTRHYYPGNINSETPSDHILPRYQTC